MSHLLLLDDEPLVLKAVGRRLLRLPGVDTIDVVTNVDEALFRITERPPDLIVTDLYLGDKETGQDLVQRLLPRHRSIPVVLHSGSITKSVRRCGLFDAYIVKGDYIGLDQAVQRWLP